jgi:DNA repair protein RadC
MNGPRERLLDLGPGALTDEELLAVLLGTGSIKNRGAVRENEGHRFCLAVVELSGSLLRYHGGLKNLLSLSPSILQQMPGIGEVKSARISVVNEIARRLLAPVIKTGMVISDAKSAYALFRDLGQLDQEELWVATLNHKNRVIDRRRVFVGRSNTCAGSPREILQYVLGVKGDKFIAAHNHPSLDPTPSKDDLSFTVKLKEAARVVGIPLLDHLIIGGNDSYCSMDDYCTNRH